MWYVSQEKKLALLQQEGSGRPLMSFFKSRFKTQSVSACQNFEFCSSQPIGHAADYCLKNPVALFFALVARTASGFVII